MATHLVIEAADVSKRGLRDAAAHRQGVAPVYNAYARVGADPAFAGRQGDYQALLRPLFMLSFLVDDYLGENAFFGARRVLLSSASSKTAFGLAHLLHEHRKDIRVIGLTSAANADFVSSLGCYDEVVTYDAVTSLPSGFTRCLRRHGRQQRVAREPASAFRRTNEIFRAHRAHAPQFIAGRAGIAGRQAELVLRARPDAQTRQGMGPRRHRSAFGAAWSGFAPMLDRWLKVIEGRGTMAVKQVYLDTLNGRVPPDQGHILSLTA